MQTVQLNALTTFTHDNCFSIEIEGGENQADGICSVLELDRSESTSGNSSSTRQVPVSMMIK